MLQLMYIHDIVSNIAETSPIGGFFSVLTFVFVFLGVLLMLAMLIQDKTHGFVPLEWMRVFFAIIYASALCTLLAIIFSCFNI